MRRRRSSGEIEKFDLRPKRRNIQRAGSTGGWVGPQKKESVQHDEVYARIASAPIEFFEAEVAPAPDVVQIARKTSASIIQKRKKELVGVCQFLESNFLQQVQRHFDTVLVESADMAYSRNKLGRPTKCMSQKESVQQTIDKMQEHLTKMKNFNVDCPDFDASLKKSGQVFMELHSMATAGCMTLHATFKKKGAAKSRQRSRRSKRTRRKKRPDTAKATATATGDMHWAAPIDQDRSFLRIESDAPVSNYVMHGHGGHSQFANPPSEFYMDDMDMDMEITDVMDMDFDTELPTDAIDMDIVGVDMPMRVDEDTDFMSENLFEKLASIV